MLSYGVLGGKYFLIDALELYRLGGSDYSLIEQVDVFGMYKKHLPSLVIHLAIGQLCGRSRAVMFGHR